MRERSGKRKGVRNKGRSPLLISKTPKSQKLVPKQSESAVSKSILSGHYNNYKDIVLQLIQRKAHYLSPYGNNSSYEEWAKTQDQLAIDHASSHTIEDVLKTRIKLTRENFMDNLNWKTLDKINFLVSSHSEMRLPRSTGSSKIRGSSPFPQRNPIVLTAETQASKKFTKAGLSDRSKPAGSGTGKPSSENLTTRKPSPTLSLEKWREPVYPKKHEPTYKLSNYDYVKRGWTKLPDYSITYRCYTLGAEPAFPALWAFRRRTDGRKHFYPNTNKLAADFEGESPYYVHYPNGEVAISINEGRVGPRLIVYSMSKKDESGRWIESRPQAMFDSKGNGVVYDLEGKIRMNYDQIEGAIYSNSKRVRPVLHWYWKESAFPRMTRDDLTAVPADHNDDIDPNRPTGESRKSKSSKVSKKKSHKNLSSKIKRKDSMKSKAPTNSTTGKKSKISEKSPKSAKNKGKHLKHEISKEHESRKVKITSSHSKIETGKSKSATGTKSKSSSKSNRKKGGASKRSFRGDLNLVRKKPLHPKPITEIAPLAIKITDYVAMRIMNQQHIHLDYECGRVHFRLYLGVNVKPLIVERIDKVVNPKKVSNITPCYFELMPLRSMSLHYLNKKVQEMKKEGSRREYMKNIRSIGGFYAWWLKKKRVAFEKNICR